MPKQSGSSRDLPKVVGLQTNKTYDSQILYTMLEKLLTTNECDENIKSLTLTTLTDLAFIEENLKKKILEYLN